MIYQVFKRNFWKLKHSLKEQRLRVLRKALRTVCNFAETIVSLKIHCEKQK